MMVFKATEDVNVREGPSTDYEIIGTMSEGDRLEDISVKWCPTWMEDNTIGWVSRRLLEEEGEIEEAPPPPSTVVTGKKVVQKAMSQAGDPYIFGYEVDLKDVDPEAFDCSELVEWTCAQLGVEPRMPDGAAAQADHCGRNGTKITIQEAVKTPGALLFRLYPSGNHVVISRGDGSTIEAKGKDYGVGVFSTAGRGWNYAARIPGVTYA